MSPGGRTSSSPPPALRSIAAGHALALLGMPLLASGDERALVAVATVALAIALGALVARAVARAVPRPRWAIGGVALIAVSAVLIAVTPRGALNVLIALVGGAGVGLILPRLAGAPRVHVLTGAVLGAVELVAARAAGGDGAGVPGGEAVAAAVARIRPLRRGPPPR